MACHGVDGMCYNAGHDTEKIQRAAKAAHANGMEYHAWIPAMLQHGLDSTLRREPKAKSAIRTGGMCLITNAIVPEPSKVPGGSSC